VTDVRIKPSALRELSLLPEEVQVAFDDAIEVLRRSPNPLRPIEPLDIKEMRRAKRLWRLRVNKYRAIFRWDGSILDIVMVDHRRRVYARLSELGL
jgi:mRNA-degrading endonuclease RelE of RelBE toxin-antitoxin system